MSQLQDSDIAEAAAHYIWASIGRGRLVPLETAVRRVHEEEAEHEAFVVAVHALLIAFQNGERLTAHRSGDTCEPLREDFRRLGYE